MKRLQFIRRIAGTSFAFLAFLVAQSASTQVCIIFHQDEIPEKVRTLNKKGVR